MAQMKKKSGSNMPRTPKSPSNAVKKPLPKLGAKPGTRKPAVRDPYAPPSPRRLLPRDSNAAPSPRQLLAKTTTSASKRTAAKPKVAKRAPLETKRIGGIFAVPAKPKKTIY